MAGCLSNNTVIWLADQDMDAIIEYSQKCTSCVVMGGGLLGLEAAKACADLNMKTHVLEAFSRLMPRQLDDAGATQWWHSGAPSA